MQKVSIDLDEQKSIATPANFGFMEKLSFLILLITPFILPIFFIPSVVFPVSFSKGLFVTLMVIISFSLWIIARLKDGRIIFPSTLLLLSGGAVVAVTLISALFSGSIGSSFVGQSLDVGTAGSVTLLFLFLFLVSSYFKSKDKIFYAYLVFFATFFLIAAFQILRLIFGVDFLSAGVLTSATSNTVGRWNDLAVFFGIGTVLSLITLELISLGKLFRVLAYVALAISIFFLALVDFSQVWYVVALFSLMFLVYVISFDKSEQLKNSSPDVSDEQPVQAFRRIPVTSLVVLLISLVFILGGNSIGSAISNKLNIAQIEARPSWGATISVAKGVMAHDPFLGSGPNRFKEQWLMYKPDGINSTIFWNTDFVSGFGFLPTMIVTTGLLGTIGWIIFLLIFGFIGFRAILSAVGDKVSRYLVTSSFLTSFFLWIVNIFYTPSLSILALTFFFTGLFIASLLQSGVIKQKTISLIDDPKVGFVSVLVLILLLIGTITSGYSLIEKFVSAVYFQKGAIAFGNEGNVDKAEGYVLKAVNLDNRPEYQRSLAQINMTRLSGLFPQSDKISQDVLRTQFQQLFSSALNHSEQAVSLDPKDYQNWVSLGQVYEAVVPLKIENAYESAYNAYNQALTLNPKSPAILLTLGRLEASKGDNDKAKGYIAQSLQQKRNYTDAIFLLAQIQIGEGNIKDAIASVEAATILSPNDSGAFFQLGLLRYNESDFKGAASAFEQALVINPFYANAKYFLGLSYSKLGKNDEAIKQFQDLKATNPDSKEVDLILKNLIAGLNPFANATPPIDSKPEKRSTPPVQEKSADTSRSGVKSAGGSDKSADVAE